MRGTGRRERAVERSGEHSGRRIHAPFDRAEVASSCPLCVVHRATKRSCDRIVSTSGLDISIAVCLASHLTVTFKTKSNYCFPYKLILSLKIELAR